MKAHVGDWLVIPPAPHDPHGRRGQIVELVHPDGSPPYRVRWLEDEHLSLVFPPPNAHVQSPRTRPVVMVAVDGSESSIKAAHWAAGLRFGAPTSLRLAHVGAGENTRPAWLRELSAELTRDGVEHTVDTITAADVPAELTRLSTEVDLLVVGSFGEGSGAGMRVGSNALGLLDGATSAVAVVRGREEGSPIPDHGVVAAGVDGSPESVAALDLAAELAEGWGAALLVVHTWRDVANEPGRGIYRVPEDWDKMAADATEMLNHTVDAVHAVHPDLTIERRVVADGPLSALLDVAPDARLIVVGSRGKRPKPGMLMGSTSRGLVEFCPCPVLVVRPQAGRSARRLAATHSALG